MKTNLAGPALALASGILFTAANFSIKAFDLQPSDVSTTRSALTCLSMGLITLLKTHISLEPETGDDGELEFPPLPRSHQCRHGSHIICICCPHPVWRCHHTDIYKPTLHFIVRLVFIWKDPELEESCVHDNFVSRDNLHCPATNACAKTTQW